MNPSSVVSHAAPPHSSETWIETRALVVRVEGDTAWVSAAQGQGCAGCSGQSVCGLSGLIKGRHARVIPLTRIEAREGEELLLSLASSTLLKAGALVYLLPTTLAVAGAALVAAAGGTDAMAMQGAGTGLLLGLLVARWANVAPGLRVRRADPSTTPGAIS